MRRSSKVFRSGWKASPKLILRGSGSSVTSFLRWFLAIKKCEIGKLLLIFKSNVQFLQLSSKTNLDTWSHSIFMSRLQFQLHVDFPLLLWHVVPVRIHFGKLPEKLQPRDGRPHPAVPLPLVPRTNGHDDVLGLHDGCHCNWKIFGRSISTFLQPSKQSFNSKCFNYL